MEQHRIDPGVKTALRIQLLGGFSVCAGAAVIPAEQWKSRRARSLVKLLALALGHRLHRDQVMDTLWPDSDLTAAANNFHQTLFGARKLLEGAGELVLEDGFLSLSASAGQALVIDVEQFEKAAAEARDGQDPAVFQSALAIYTGDLLPEDLYEAWTSERRESLRQAYLKLLLDLARLHEARGEYPQGIEVCQRLLSADRSHEEAHRGLMRLYARAGERQQALRQYQTLKDMLYQELEIEPEEETRRLHQDILAGRVAAQTPAPAAPQPGRPAHNLPRPLTSLIGREKEIARVKKMVRERALVTLTGAGGVGKTRLALAVAESLAGDTVGPAPSRSLFTDGIWLVELAPLADAALVVRGIAEVFGLREEPGHTVQESLLKYLQNRRVLLVLDNCEHLIEACAALLLVLLRGCPGLKVLTASREPLGLPGEGILRVESLALPENGQDMALADLEQVEAVRLFLDRAQSKLADFALTRQNAAAVVDICRRLDGIPLAIELAASRVDSLEVGQIAARLERTFRLLAGAEHGVSERQRTLRATIDWSYQLLSAAEKLLLQRLSIFRGGWTLEAAEAVCADKKTGDSSAASAAEAVCADKKMGDSSAASAAEAVCADKKMGDSSVASAAEGLAEEDIANLLAQLVHKSMVVTTFTADYWLGDPLPGYTMRYRLLKTIHQYAQEVLAAAEQLDDWRDRHLTYFTGLAEAIEPKLLNQEAPDRFYQLHLEQDNLLSALTWALEAAPQPRALEGTRLIYALARFWDFISFHAQPQAGLEKAIGLLDRNNPEHKLTLAKACYMNGLLLRRLDRSDEARPYFEESIQLYRECDDRLGLSLAYQLLGSTYWGSGWDRFKLLMETSMQLMQETGGIVSDKAGGTADDKIAKKWYLARLYGDLGEYYWHSLKDTAQSIAFHKKCIALYEETGDRWSSNCSIISLSWIYAQLGDFEKAREMNDAVTAIYREQSERPFFERNPHHLAMTAYYLRDYPLMETYYREAVPIFNDKQMENPANFTRRMLALAVLRQGRIQQAAAYFLDTFNQERDPFGQRACLGLLAGIALAAGRLVEAAHLLGAFKASFANYPRPVDSWDQTEYDRHAAALTSQMGEQGFQSAWAEGCALSFEQALALARSLGEEIGRG